MHNCFLIRALSTNGGIRDADHVEPFDLKSYGDTAAEPRELMKRLGWPGIGMDAKFYSHHDVDNGFYFVYTTSARSSPHNEIASRCCGSTIQGDVAVIISGPEDSNDYDETFTKTELLKTLDFYRKASPDTVSNERERSRIERKTGISLDGVPSFHL